MAELTASAASLLAGREGGVDAHLPGVTATLEAASLDPEAGSTVLAGRLTSELEPPSGFGDPGDAPAGRPTRRVEPPAGAEPQVDVARDQLAQAGRRAEELATAARAAASRAAELRRSVEEAGAEVARLTGELDTAKGRLAAVTAEATDAQRAALAADQAAAAGAERQDDAERRLRAAEA